MIAGCGNAGQHAMNESPGRKPFMPLLLTMGIVYEITRMQDETCIEMMKSFIDSKPELWNEDIGA